MGHHQYGSFQKFGAPLRETNNKDQKVHLVNFRTPDFGNSHTLKRGPKPRDVEYNWFLSWVSRSRSSRKTSGRTPCPASYAPNVPHNGIDSSLGLYIASPRMTGTSCPAGVYFEGLPTACCSMSDSSLQGFLRSRANSTLTCKTYD